MGAVYSTSIGKKWQSNISPDSRRKLNLNKNNKEKKK